MATATMEPTSTFTPTTTPAVGDKVTKCGYSDSHPYIVTEVIGANKIVVSELKATLSKEWKPEMHPGGFCAHTSNCNSQEWDIAETAEPDAARYTISRRKDGSWQNVGGSKYVGCNRTWLFGVASRFHDYNF